MNTPSPEYLAALETAREASRVFAKAQADYRARRIGDREFLAARAVYDESDRAFDAAFAAEDARDAAKGGIAPCLTLGSTVSTV